MLERELAIGVGMGGPQQALLAGSSRPLNEINQCSELVEESPDMSELNPPLIQPIGPPPPPPQQQPPEPASLPPNDGPQEPPATRFYNEHPQQQQQQPVWPALDTPPPADPFIQQQHNQQLPFDIVPPIERQVPAPAARMPLTSFLLASVALVCVALVGLALFVFVRQHQNNRRHHQQQDQSSGGRRHHKKSSAASTASGSSSVSSSHSTAANKHPHPFAHLAQHQHQLLSHHHHHHHQHHAHLQHQHQQQQQQQQHPHQPAPGQLHQHSASSQSNIYAALVSPSTGSSTIVTSTTNANAAAAGAQRSGRGTGAALFSQQQTNNLYSNSSTTSSLSGSQHQQGANNNQWPHHQHQHHHQHQIYAAHSLHYGTAAAAASPNDLYGHHQHHLKSFNASLYGSEADAAKLGSQHELGGAASHQAALHWLGAVPKMRQFFSKLINKSSLINYRSNCLREQSFAIQAHAFGPASDKIYDAFLSYDKNDEPFVMQHLAAELEYGHPQYRIADRYRDLPLPSSAYIAEAITSVIGCSHRTIIVLTPNYLANEWCRFELRAALRECALDKSHRIVAVVVEPKCLMELDDEMRALLAAQSPPLLATGASGGARGPLAGRPAHQQQQQQQQQPLVQLERAGDELPPLVATLTSGGQAGGQQLVSTQAATGAGRIAFVGYNEPKFWPKLRQLMPAARAGAHQALTLTTKN